MGRDIEEYRIHGAAPNITCLTRTQQNFHRLRPENILKTSIFYIYKETDTGEGWECHITQEWRKK